jgi:hypothetical protein
MGMHPLKVERRSRPASAEAPEAEPEGEATQ